MSETPTTSPDVAAIHAALEASGGRQREAARALGISTLSLAARLRSEESLRKRWVLKETGTPGEASDVHRPAAMVVVNGEKMLAADAEALAKAAEEEDVAVRKGLLAIGVSGKGLEVALSLQKLQRRHFQSCLDMLGGGITKQFLTVMAEVEKIDTALEDAALPMEEKIMLREDRARLLDIMGKFYDKASRSSLIKAMIEEKKKGKNGQGKSKPGFGVLVKGDNVEIHEHHHDTPAD